MAERVDPRLCFENGGRMGALLAAHDWSASPLGSPETWPQSLRTSVGNMLASGFATFITWGPDLTLFYNDAYSDILGSKHPAALGQPFPQVWSEVWDSIADLHRRTMMDGETHTMENLPLRLRHRGHLTDAWFTYCYAPIRDEAGIIRALQCICIDTTQSVLAGRERDRVLGELRQLNETLEQQVKDRTVELRLYRDIVLSDPTPVLAFDTRHRSIGFNRAHFDAFIRVMGREPQLGENLPDLFPPEQGKVLRSLMDRVLAGEAFSVVQEFGDETTPSWDLTYTPLRDEAGTIVGAFHRARDISERLRADRELAMLQEQLVQSQKMEAVGQLTGGVAHDFNNLLTVIKSSTDLLKRPNLPEDRRVRYVAAISDTVDRAARLTGQLLAFARRQALKPEVFDACDSVRALSDMMGTLTGSRITVASTLLEERCFVLADPSQFDTALINMAVNARDAMDGAGRLTLDVRSVDALPAVRAHPAIPGSYVAVSLTDTGIGIASDQIDRIFEPFYTTKETGKGTGLGLSQVFGFAKQSGGDIAVSSALGEGTIFTLYLPRVAAREHVEEKIEPATLIDGHGTRVLVVEDNADVGAFAVQSLSDLGYQPVLTCNGEAALVELAKGADRFDVVFSDVVMPGMGGIELGQEIRRLYHDLPVVLTSGYSHVLAQNGTYGFELLHKPYSVEQLSQILRKVATWKRRKRLMQ